jgi:D-alanyl-D-alanine carboxypeptidase
MLVKSANDMAVVLAEGVGGSIDGFSAMENATAQKLGMTQTHYVNPNGLPADGQITSARDMAILARSFIKNLPEYEAYVHIPSIRYGKRITQNFNKLIGRYPGADGFKTGFICASGYNLVASATRDGRRLIAVVMGASSGMMRSVRAAQLLDRGFANNGLAWLRPSLGTVDQLAPIDTTPPDLHDEVCSGKHHRQSDEDEMAASPGSTSATGDGSNGATFLASSLQAPMPKPSEWLAAAPAPSDPIVVYTGPTRTGAALVAAVAADADSQTVAARHGKRHAGKKPAATAEATPADASAAKPAGKSAAKHAAAKPAATATDSAAAPAAKPARPKANAKPKSGAANGQKTSGEAKPAGD